jgi:hypothetical protein
MEGNRPTLVGTQQGGADGGTSPALLTVAGDRLFFSALGASGKAGLFETDGTIITPVSGAGANPAGLIASSRLLFFQAESAASGTELYAANPSAAPEPLFKVFIEMDSREFKEGQSARFSANVRGPKLKYRYEWDFADSTGIERGSKRAVHTYHNNLPKNAPRRVEVTVIAPDGTRARDSIEITITNAPPQLKLVTPAKWVATAPMPFFGSATDPGALDELDVSVQFITTSGSEILHPKPDGKGMFRGLRVFRSEGPVLMSVTVRDGEGGKRSATRNINVVGLLQIDPRDPAFKALGIIGTLVGANDNDNSLSISKAPQQPRNPAQQAVQVLIDGVVNNVILTTPQLRIFTGGGNDKVQTDPGIQLIFPVPRPLGSGKRAPSAAPESGRARTMAKGAVPLALEINGGAGKDTLSGGDGNDTLNGESGSDLLQGRAGKDQLNGGPGNDRLSGGGGRDQLIGGDGNDRLSGGAGTDQLIGGAGNDLLLDVLGENRFVGRPHRDSLESGG